jgi:hypothetical protein
LRRAEVRGQIAEVKIKDVSRFHSFKVSRIQQGSRL